MPSEIPFWVPCPASKKPESQERMQARCEAWNRDHPVGTSVEYLPTRGERTGLLKTATRSDAYILSGHSPVIFIAGISGCVHLDHVRAVAEMNKNYNT